MSIESATARQPAPPREATPSPRASGPAPPRARPGFADRLSEDPGALLAAALGRPGVGPLRDAGAASPVAAPRPVAPPLPTLESQGVESLRVRTVGGAGEVALRVRTGDGTVEVHLRETARAGLEVSLSGSVPEADLERLSGAIARRLGPEARVELAAEPPPRRGDEDRRDREPILELEEEAGSRRKQPRHRSARPGSGC
jgi:hypothetical protein